MPYIPHVDRRDLSFGNRDPETPGELNWAITVELVAYVDRMGLSYTTINEVIGALEAAKLEFYRRVAVPYEKKKMVANGDVY